jgi:hypothetical protein
MGQIKIVDELLIRGGLFERMKVDAVKILNDGLFQGEPIVDVILDEHRNHL